MSHHAQACDQVEGFAGPHALLRAANSGKMAIMAMWSGELLLILTAISEFLKVL